MTKLFKPRGRFSVDQNCVLSSVIESRLRPDECKGKRQQAGRPVCCRSALWLARILVASAVGRLKRLHQGVTLMWN